MMSINHNKPGSIIGLIILFYTTISFAHKPVATDWRAIISLGAGVFWSSDFDNSQNFKIAGNEFYQYHGNNDTQQAVFYDVFVGGEWAFKPKWALQLGLAYSGTGGFDSQGTYLQGFDYQSANEYAYQYKITTQQIQAEGKLLYEFKERFHPYFLLGLGLGLNDANNYKTNVPPFLTFTREYESHTTTTFTYNLGLGIDIDLNESWRLGAGYRFADLGSVQLVNPTIDAIRVNGTLNQSHLYSNVVLAQISYKL